MIRSLVSFTVALAGCNGGHSGVDYVLVDVSAEVQAACVHTVIGHDGESICGEELVRRAAHFWDSAGAKFRTVEDWPEDLPANDRLSVKATLSDLRDLDIGGYYTRGDDVRVNLASWDWAQGEWNDQLAEQVVAHELGHAMGLGHLPDCATLMAGDNYGCSELTPMWGPTEKDLAEYRTLWGGQS